MVVKMSLVVFWVEILYCLADDPPTRPHGVTIQKMAMDKCVHVEGACFE
jgi:hypothetical protein